METDVTHRHPVDRGSIPRAASRGAAPPVTRHRLPALAAAAVLLAFAGCPFDTREPVPPVDDSEIPEECRSQDVQDPVELLRSFETAFECTENGVTLFAGLHADDFVFTSPFPDDDTFVNGQPIDQIFSQRLSPLAGQSVIMTISEASGSQVTEGDITRFINVTYTLKIELGSTEVDFGGITTITVRDDGTTQVITSWEDNEGAFGPETIGAFWQFGTAGRGGG